MAKKSYDVEILEVDESNSKIKVKFGGGSEAEFPVVAPAKINYAKVGNASISVDNNQVSFVKSVQGNVAEGNQPKQDIKPATNYTPKVSNDSERMASVCVSYAKDVWCAGKIEQAQILEVAKMFQETIQNLAQQG